MRLVFGLVDQALFTDPRHHVAQLAAYLLDEVGSIVGVCSLERVSFMTSFLGHAVPQNRI